MTDIPIQAPPIRLDQFLKLARVAQTGGHAKFMVTAGSVRVNGEVEMRRGRQLVPGDVVEVIPGGVFRVVSSP